MLAVLSFTRVFCLLLFPFFRFSSFIEAAGLYITLIEIYQVPPSKAAVRAYSFLRERRSPGPTRCSNLGPAGRSAPLCTSRK